MTIRFTGFLMLLIMLSRCGTKTPQETTSMAKDPHSFSKPSEASVTHLSWKATVNFETKKIAAVASWKIKTNGDADIVLLDTKGLNISKVTLDNGQPTEFKLADEDPILGRS